MTILEGKLWSEREQLRKENVELRRALAEALVLNDALRAELDATMAEQPAGTTQVALFAEPDPAQQRRPRLALVRTDDPPLELAPDAIIEAVAAVPGVERVSVDSMPEHADVFVVSVRGGDDQDIARAILRTLPNSSVRTAGNTRIEVDEGVVFIGRPDHGNTPTS